jgi:hypothetical protein
LFFAVWAVAKQLVGNNERNMNGASF